MDDIRSIMSLPEVPIAALPTVGTQAPAFPHPLKNTARPSLVVFLRHCGCPFSEVAFQSLNRIIEQYGDRIACHAVSHATQQETQDWVASLGLPHSDQVSIVIDTDRSVYGAWGLGQTSLMHWLGYNSLSAVFAYAKQGIKNRTTKGSRWQQSGQFAVDETGKLILCAPAQTADQVADLEAAAKSMLNQSATASAKL